MKIFKREIVELVYSGGYLKNDEILLFFGARQAGKTTILHLLEDKIRNQSGVTFFANLEDPDYLRLLNKSPKKLFEIFPIDLKQRTTIFIDEVQYLENPTNFLKYFYDEYKGKIKLIVSGSSAFYLDQKFKDSLAGRKVLLPVYTLSFKEFLRFKDELGLYELLPNSFNIHNYKLNKKVSLSQKEKLRKYFNEFVTYGGYPRVVLAETNEKKRILEEIVYSYIKKDIYDAGVGGDQIFYSLFKILASQVGNLVNVNELSSLLNTSRTSIRNYLSVMQKSFHLCLVRPFYTNIRKELKKMPKVYFYDLGLRNFLVNDFRGIKVRKDKGEVLENSVFRQLLDRSGVFVADEIKFWRTQTQAEVDFIFKDKIAFEVKFNPKLFKPKKYSSFQEKYPKIRFNLVCAETVGLRSANYPVWLPWWI